MEAIQSNPSIKQWTQQINGTRVTLDDGSHFTMKGCHMLKPHQLAGLQTKYLVLLTTEDTVDFWACTDMEAIETLKDYTIRFEPNAYRLITYPH